MRLQRRHNAVGDGTVHVELRREFGGADAAGPPGDGLKG